MEPITSTRNPRVAQVAALSRRRERREQGLHLAEGPNAVEAAIASGNVSQLWATEQALASFTPPEHVEVTIVAEHVLERVADSRTPQGLVAVVRTTTSSLAEVVGQGLLVVLDAVADPGNAGTIIRTADAVGAAAVVLTTGSVDAFGPKTVRAAAGSTYHLPIVGDVELEDVAAACRAVGQPVYGLDGGGERPVEDLEVAAPPFALVLGNEAHGLSSASLALLDAAVAIPIYGRAESLNVAAAAAVALYAAARGVHRPPPPPDTTPSPVDTQ